MKTTWFRILMGALVCALLLGGLIGCGPTETPTTEVEEIPTEEPTGEEELATEPIPTATRPPPPPPPSSPGVQIRCSWVDRDGALAPVETDRYTIRGQIIVTGPFSSVEVVVGTVAPPTHEAELRLLRTCEIWVPERNLLEPYFPPALVNQWLRMDLYAVDPEEQRAAVIAALNEMGQQTNDEGIPYNVVADPNYITSLDGQSVCGTPYTVVGSPYTVVGSPYTVVGSPEGMPLSLPDAEALFRDQWAWYESAMGPALPSDLAATSTGAGIRIGVLDTAPFAVTGPVAIDWMTPEWSLTMSLTTLSQEYPEADMPPGIVNHGLFVAGLIHGAAPDSDIRLIQVLDEHGCGSLSDLATQMYAFTKQVDLDRESLSGAVLNLSLGVPITPGIEIDALEKAVFAALDAGVVVVAAAGNDSYAAETRPQDAQLPAGYGPVIGVGASNVAGDEACFSNKGDVDAPGGQGGENPAYANLVPAGMDCLPMNDQCVGACDYALISLGLIPDPGYYYWSGTSFSTALVSGLAALKLQACDAAGVWIEPDAVFQAIEPHATPPSGDLINAPDTLGTACPP